MILTVGLTGPGSATEGATVQNLWILVALGFASYRATQLVVWDTIGDKVRNLLEIWHARKFESPVRTFVRDLIGCTYCAGWWLSLVTVAVYLTGARQWGAASIWVHAVEFWSVAGVQALLNRWDDSRPGHNPEAR